MESMMKLLFNAFIHTQNLSQPTASALVIDREWVLAVGDAADLFTQYPNAEKQDMDGRVILPGLTDAHLHLQHYSLGLQKIDCETPTKDVCVAWKSVLKIRSPVDGSWVMAGIKMYGVRGLERPNLMPSRRIILCI
jgi:predicted amidohydrolase YtcJ